MRQGFKWFLAMVNIALAGVLVAGAVGLYLRDYDTRQMERQIRTLQRATALEDETSRRLQIEWQRLRNPMRLEPLARLKLNLMPPDPLAVLPRGQALAMLPLRPPPVAEEAGAAGADALSALAAEAAQQPGAAAVAAEPVEPVEGVAAPNAVAGDAAPADDAAAARAPAANDALGNLINGIMQDGGGQP